MKITRGTTQFARFRMPLTLQQALCLYAAVTEKTTCPCGCLPSQLGRDKRPAASACFHQPQALCGIQILSRLRHSFCIRLGSFYAGWAGLSSLPIVFSLYLRPGCISPVFPLFFARRILDKRGGACYLFIYNKCDDDATHSSPFSESRRLLRADKQEGISGLPSEQSA